MSAGRVSCPPTQELSHHRVAGPALRVLGIPDAVRHRRVGCRGMREAPVIVDHRIPEHPSAIDTTVHHEAAFCRHEVETPGRPAALRTGLHALFLVSRLSLLQNNRLGLCPHLITANFPSLSQFLERVDPFELVGRDGLHLTSAILPRLGWSAAHSPPIGC